MEETVQTPSAGLRRRNVAANSASSSSAPATPLSPETPPAKGGDRDELLGL